MSILYSIQKNADKNECNDGVSVYERSQNDTDPTTPGWQFVLTVPVYISGCVSLPIRCHSVLRSWTSIRNTIQHAATACDGVATALPGASVVAYRQIGACFVDVLGGQFASGVDRLDEGRTDGACVDVNEAWSLPHGQSASTRRDGVIWRHPFLSNVSSSSRLFTFISAEHLSALTREHTEGESIKIVKHDHCESKRCLGAEYFNTNTKHKHKFLTSF